MVPVPTTEPIPIADFFRPRVLQDPTLNPSGTHIAAIITAGEDKYERFVYGLDTKKFEQLGAFADKDIYSVTWLNDRRLLFELSFEKQYGEGLFAAEVGSIGSAYPIPRYLDDTTNHNR